MNIHIFCQMAYLGDLIVLERLKRPRLDIFRRTTTLDRQGEVIKIKATPGYHEVKCKVSPIQIFKGCDLLS